MGLFDFAKEIGSKLFSSDAEAAAKITAYIEADNPGIQDLSVIFNDGKATLIGVTTSVEAAQKVVLMAGNVQGVSEVIPKIDILDIDEESEEEEASTEARIDMAQALESDDVEYYVIKSGDSLSKIAQHFYGNGADYPRIFAANKEVIKDPDRIYPGQKIRIPKS